MERDRLAKYLQRRYSFLAVSRQKIELEKIISRLEDSGKFDPGALYTIVETLVLDGWILPKIMAHLDLLDIEERT